MKHLDLFSGIGGFALAARWVGWETVGFCEIDPYCQKVLAKHWPDVPIHQDVTELDGRKFKGAVDIITGGFPCQDISVAGKGAGIDGERSGLWSDLARLIGEIRPAYAVLENVSALLGRGLGRVAGDLAEIRYDCEWHCIPAFAVGAPHRRDRIWIISYPIRAERESGSGRRRVRQGDPKLADADRKRSQRIGANSYPQGWKGQIMGQTGLCNGTSDGQGQWSTEPDVGRVAHGIPRQVHRLKCLGNSIVPQIAEALFRQIGQNGAKT